MRALSCSMKITSYVRPADNGISSSHTLSASLCVQCLFTLDIQIALKWPKPHYVHMLKLLVSKPFAQQCIVLLGWFALSIFTFFIYSFNGPNRCTVTICNKAKNIYGITVFICERKKVKKERVKNLLYRIYRVHTM